MMWVFWSLVCFVSFMIMWPAFEKQVPPDLMPWLHRSSTVTTTPGGGTMLPTQRKIGSWLFQESTDGWVMVIPAKEGVQTDSGQGEPPLLFVMCHATWVESRAALIEDKSAELKVKGFANSENWMFTVTPTRLMADSPDGFTSKMARKADTLAIKVPYADYGTQKFHFPLNEFPKAWAALKSTCQK